MNKIKIVKGVIAANSHAAGCKEMVRQQILDIKNSTPIHNAPKNVLILGGSSGLGLASRISLAFGGQANTLNVSYERPPHNEDTGTAGYHNNMAFQEFAKDAGLIAEDFIGDAFSDEMRQKVVTYIQDNFGQIDCLVYSLATGIRPKKNSESKWKSSLKTIGEPFQGNFISFEPEMMMSTTLESATEDEIEGTVKVMGGEDWHEWVDVLRDANVLAPEFKTIAYSYIGSEVTYPVYFGGTLGKAKEHLHMTADELDLKLSDINGHAYVAVCKALVSKASVFIPGLSTYVLALMKEMKERGENETTAQHMHRIMNDFLYNPEGTPTDENRLIRADNLELNPDVQIKIKEMIKNITPSNYKDPSVGDYESYRKEFYQINGFEVDGVDYS
ncbi:enoyl-ACP reductase FabV [Photobacterium damselae]|uniref:trans-2-enoyl-CoA reductase (NAD(+)) n=1 Tax=Photobacterium damselae subsp. damselae TaxID=85581 RepID=A0AAD3WSB9_PHODD|nr:enoyl-ACP reductase FabV [Photobacterium damselae]KAB1173674.1 trans-2-enoyl-CoA reductase family protein [Photobacterium damselae subsp. damselae]KAB1175593.1 trans-2-enoyl-CoA reductase family protein [Photobacterium damselae subsp. damselae]MBF7098322.1 trans-2-enoyl-CoA reductase family protein [Photobacterium damselae]NVO73700.1 trans-2-enoyl-CoA reductase family protein [Photobacterium damselae subsp. damselae]QSH58998.1 trans-2-enoyl-CoA reductase family protein [Photobacterium damse